MSHSYNNFVVKAYQNRSAQEILAAAPDALKGVSSADAQLLEQAFGIHAVRDFAENKFFQNALVILAGVDTPGFDPGPPPSWSAFFARAPVDFYQQFPNEFRLEFGPVYYRGRLDGTARIIVVGQDPSVNEILAQRIFVGRSGQRVQGFLRKLGISRSYIMLNTFLYSVHGQYMGNLKSLSTQDPLLSYRNEYLSRSLDMNPIEAVIAVGRGAQDAVEHWPHSAEITVVNITHPSAHDEQALLNNWNEALEILRPIINADDGAEIDHLSYGTKFSDADQVAIPRFDLPFGLPDWHGVGGGHATRDGPDKIIWNSPL